MKKNKTVKKSISSIICAGLLISSLPATLPIRAQQQPIMQPGVPQKLSKAEINKKIKTIKTTIRAFQTANWVVPLILGTIAVVSLLVAGGITIATAKPLKRWIKKQLGKVKKLGEKITSPFRSEGETAGEIAKTTRLFEKMVVKKGAEKPGEVERVFEKAEALAKRQLALGKKLGETTKKVSEMPGGQRWMQKLERVVELAGMSDLALEFSERVKKIRGVSGNLYSFLTLLVSEDPSEIASFWDIDKINVLINSAKEKGFLKDAVGFISLENQVILASQTKWFANMLKKIGELSELKPATEKVRKFTASKVARMIAAAIALIGFVGPSFLMVISGIGIFPFTVWKAFATVGELERMEKQFPGTLTKKQKDTLLQLKNMALRPIPQGIIKFFALKDAQKAAAAALLEKNPVLGSTIAFGKPKKARTVVGNYIKLKWMEQNTRNVLEQLAKETTPELQKDYKKTVKELEKTEQKIKKLEAEHPSLAKAPELEDAVQEFRTKADDILEGLKTPVIEEEIAPSRPMIVPL